MSRRSWLFIGAAFGFLVPIFLNIAQHIATWHVRPCAYLLFLPAASVLSSVVDFMFLLALVLNAAIFGMAAYALRAGFVALIAVLLAIAYISLPPSDATLEQRLAVQRLQFERMIQKADETPSIVRIEKLEIEDVNGTKYKATDKQNLLTLDSWNEYREMFNKTGMKEGLYRSPQTGQIKFIGHTFLGKIGPIGTLYGYVYCPASFNDERSKLLPCKEKKEEWDIGDYRYKRINSEWYIVEMFRTKSLMN